MSVTNETIYTVHCNGPDCGKFFKTTALSTAEAVRAAKAVNWTVHVNRRRVTVDHLCPQCSAVLAQLDEAP